MRARSPVAEDGRWSAGQDRGHPAPGATQVWMTNRIDASMDAVQAPRADPAINRALAEPERRELAARDHAVLARGEDCNRTFIWATLFPAWAVFSPNMKVDTAHPCHVTPGWLDTLRETGRKREERAQAAVSGRLKLREEQRDLALGGVR